MTPEIESGADLAVGLHPDEPLCLIGDDEATAAGTYLTEVACYRRPLGSMTLADVLSVLSLGVARNERPFCPIGRHPQE